VSTSDTFVALRRANPRTSPEFDRSVLEAEATRERIVAATAEPPDLAPALPRLRPRPVRRRVGVRAAGATLVAIAAVTAFLALGTPGGGGVESASAAVRHAAAATAASADHSGTVTVVITTGGQLWAQKTVRWSDGDMAVVDGSPGKPGGREMRLVDGMMYGQEPGVGGGWFELGDPDSIDPDSGTTPDELLAATDADLGGETLRRFSAGMTGLTTEPQDDGSTVYRGAVPPRLVAPESGFKEGGPIRVFPWGFVAHDEAADPDSPLEAAVTVGADGLISQIAVEWGSGASAWTYTVSYSDLGATPPIPAPENAEPFPPRIPAPPPTGGGS
jgi:hypothetical protein